MYLSDILYKIVAVAIIVAFSLHHRVSGLVALIVVIAVITTSSFKQTYNYATRTEGFTATIENSPILNAKNLIKDNVQKAKKMTESFFSRS
jgi:hypothetical protein